MVRSHFARHISARTNGRNKPANECINIWRRNIAKEKLSAHQNCDRKVRLIGILTDSVKKDNRRGNEFGKAETEAISGEQPKWFSISEAYVPPSIASTNGHGVKFCVNETSCKSRICTTKNENVA